MIHLLIQSITAKIEMIQTNQHQVGCVFHFYFLLYRENRNAGDWTNQQVKKNNEMWVNSLYKDGPSYRNRKLKGQYVVLEKLNIHDITEAMIYFFLHHWTNEVFSEENKIPRTQFEARTMAGSATYTHSKKVWNCVYCVSLVIWSVNEDFSLLIKTSFPNYVVHL